MSLANIEGLCSKYSTAANALNDRVIKLNKKIETITQNAKAEIDELTKKCVQTRQKLHDAIDKNADLFEKPRTQIFSGIKVGMQAGAPTLEMDESKTCELILKKMPEQKTILIKTTSKPVATALKNLDNKQLKSIGVTRIDGKDSVVLKATDTAVNKSVEAHLKQAKK